MERTRRLICLLALIALVAAPASAYVLQPVGSLMTPGAERWAAWGQQTIAFTAGEARLVRWDLPEDVRTLTLFDLPVAASAIEAWGDSLLVRLPGHQSRLLAPALGGPFAYQAVPEGWRLPNTRAAGATYRVAVDLGDDQLRVFTAPGTGTLVGLLDYGATIGTVGSGAAAADRVALAAASAVHVVSLANPFLPAIQSVIEPPVAGWAVRQIALRDRLLFVLWGNRIEVWDLADALSPVRRFAVTTDRDAMAVGDRWLLSWQRLALTPAVLVHDTADPSAVTLRGTLQSQDGLTTADVTSQGDRLVLRQATGLHAWTVPAGDAPIVGSGRAWPVLRGELLAASGQTAWLVDDRGSRFVIDLGLGRIVGRQQQPVAAHAFGDLQGAEGFLFYNPPGHGVRVESLADPQAPVVVATISRSPQIHAIDVRDGLLVAAAAAKLVLYDVAEPGAPLELGSLDLPTSLHTLALVGDAVVALSALGAPSSIHVVDIADPAQPQLVATIPVPEDPPSVAWTATQVVVRGSQAIVLCEHQAWNSRPARSLSLDLVDPQAPAWRWGALDAGFWCSMNDSQDQEVRVASDPPVAFSGLHASYRDAEVNVYRYLGDPDALELLASWTAPGPISELWAAGNRILALSGGRLDVLTLTDPQPAGVPPAPPSAAVRAVPNPFNPTTQLEFAMPQAGLAMVAIHDGRGRLVRTLRAELPAGQARLAWDGADAGGRALPSGAYLVRVTVAGATLAGRCLLVR